MEFTDHIQKTKENEAEVNACCDLIQRIYRKIMTSDLPAESQRILVDAVTNALLEKFVPDPSKSIPHGN